jgi:hypothetical protein
MSDAPFGLPHQPVRRQTTPTAISESLMGISGPTRGAALDNRHGPLGRVITRGLPLGPGHDLPTTHNAALRPYDRAPTHWVPMVLAPRDEPFARLRANSKCAGVNLPACYRD